MSRKKRLVIVGAKFGELYLNSFFEEQATVELCGLVAQGSQRAQTLADAFGISLYHSVDELPDDIDIACVVVRAAVVGGVGNSLTEALLRRGIHVIQEHPVSPQELLRHQQLAQENHVHYWVNSFYPHTPTGEAFINCASEVSQQDRHIPLFAQLTTSRQLLYSSLDIMMQAIVRGSYCDIDVDVNKLQQHEPCFDVLNVCINGCHLLIRLQNYLDPNDPDMHNLIMHQMTLGWQSGYLSLNDSYGPIIWTPVLHADQHQSTQFSLYQLADSDAGRYLREPTSVILRQPPDSVLTAIEYEGPAGVAALLQQFVHCIDSQPYNELLNINYQQQLSRVWQEIMSAVGEPQERYMEKPASIDIAALKKAVQPQFMSSEETVMPFTHHTLSVSQ